MPTSLAAEAAQIQRKLHQTIKRVSDDFQGRWHFNTCIAAIMELVNELYAVEGRVAAGDSPAKAVPASRCWLKSSALWRCCSRPSLRTWPTNSGKCWERREVCCEPRGRSTIPLWPKKTKSKSRCRSTANCAAALLCLRMRRRDVVRERALSDAKIKAMLDGKQIVKVIVVPAKLVNIVVR